MKKRTIIIIALLISLFIDVNMYFGTNWIFQPRESTSHFTFFGQIFFWLFQFNIVVGIPFTIYAALNNFVNGHFDYELNYIRDSMGKAAAVIGLIIFVLPLVAPSLLLTKTLNDPAPVLTTYGWFYFLTFIILYFFGSTFGIFELVFRFPEITNWFKSIFK